MGSDFMQQRQVAFTNDMPGSAGAAASSRPNWHAFGMLVAWSGAGGVILLSYILVSFASGALHRSGGCRRVFAALGEDKLVRQGIAGKCASTRGRTLASLIACKC
ncbi:hypothetical protein DUNSADRAFT_13333 [Dunaliella salina]|uniref:Uncharacterized protein n=1 Tax=Dunaliella salina TaxID=3046 RepID=A0ABQ7G9J2_DUNSA|nr:hypothetical protein DUNSADRAFT_13333 [Dunaliella salina]|eukprot:KAF5831277.1 hypothetical protein DUNSADRAFT_13333 [Dunaliella salina]